VELLLASENPKKRAELVALLAYAGVQVVTPSAVGGLPVVVEDRDTFRGNAEKKATSGATASGLWCLADDSGLEVDALDGLPGVRSARFAGEDADTAANNRLLLERLDGLPPEQRGASFVCTLALARPDGSIALVLAGRVQGRILTEPRGTSGFGYDPLFLFTGDALGDEPGQERTFAELTPVEKGRISHRGRALADLARQLPELWRHEDAGTEQPGTEQTGAADPGGASR